MNFLLTPLRYWKRNGRLKSRLEIASNIFLKLEDLCMVLVTQNFARARCPDLTPVGAVRFLTKDSAEASSLHSLLMHYGFCHASTCMLPEGCLPI